MTSVRQITTAFSDQPQDYRNYIDGAFVDPASNAWLETSDPVTGEDWAWVARGDGADVEQAVQAAHRAFCEGPWPALSASGRGALAPPTPTMAGLAAEAAGAGVVMVNGASA